MRAILYSLTLLCCLAAPVCAEERGLPLVVETYDCLVFFEDRVFFMRDGKVFADRIINDEMLLVVVGDQFLLLWADFWVCERAVYAKTVTFVAQESPEDPAANMAWFAAPRRMTDLLMPEVAP